MSKFMASVLMFGMSVVLVHAQGAGAKLEGVWLMTGTADKKLPEEFFDKIKVKLILKDNGQYEQNVMGMKAESGTFKIDAAKSPATIDIAIGEGKDKGKSQLGIFKLEGDKLTMAFAKPGVEVRPKNFEPMDEIDVIFLKRSK